MKKCINVIVTIGDPAGIGPEVTVKALKHLGCKNNAAFFVVGDSSILARYGFRQNSRTYVVDLKNIQARHFKPGAPNKHTALASIDYLEAASEMLKKGFGDCLVTAPISKKNVQAAGFRFPGHTEYLAQTFGVKRTEMVFASDSLKVALVTRHLALKKAIRAVTRQEIYECGKTVFKLLKDNFRIPKPRIAVCGLNPHAGEEGLFGNEEALHIKPAIRRLNKIFGPHFVGPMPADTVFYKARQGAYDLVMAMYHDQGLAPFKAVVFDQGVNLTAGLNFIRTSPVHGTAFDIAGKNKADHRSMLAAIALAYRLTLPMV